MAAVLPPGPAECHCQRVLSHWPQGRWGDPVFEEDLAPKYQRDFFLTVIDPSGALSLRVT